jgi:hypothetical protein
MASRIKIVYNKLIRTSIILLFVLLQTAAFSQVGQLPDKDSVLLPLQNKLSKSDPSKTRAPLDSLLSLKVSLPVDTLDKKKLQLDSARNAISHKMDSLNRLNLPVTKYSSKLDSINRLASSQNKLIGRAQGVENGVNEKLNLMNKESIGNANLPGRVKMPEADLNITSPSIPEVKMPGNSIPLDDIKVPGTPAEKLEKITSLSQSELPKMDGLEELEKVEDLKKISQEIDGYEDDIKKISDGNIQDIDQIPQKIEDKVENISEVQAVKKELGSAELMEAPDAETMKKKAMEMAKEQAIDHFAGKQAALKSAMEKVSKLKAKYGEFASMKDLPKRKPNEMKGKPFIERVLPGLTLQIQKTENVLIDFNPLISYRITGRLAAGIGWNERISFGSKLRVVSNDRIYGPRVNSSFRIGKGYSFKVEGEKMRTYVPPATQLIQPDANKIQWVSSLFVGLKKDYQFYKGVRGNFQILYNLYDDHNNSPYIDKLNMRFGFEFPLKKKIKDVSMQ